MSGSNPEPRPANLRRDPGGPYLTPPDEPQGADVIPVPHRPALREHEGLNVNQAS